jgi:hypothetical protein
MIHLFIPPDKPGRFAIRSTDYVLQCLLAVWLIPGLIGVTLSQAAESGQYDEAMREGDVAMVESYSKAADSVKKNEEAAVADKEACQTGNPVPEAKSAGLKKEASALDEEANAFAKTALRAYRSAERFRPDLPKPIFFEGLALSQLKSYCAAIEKIESAKGAGYESPEIQFALGNALILSSKVGSDQLQEGIDLLKEYIAGFERSGSSKDYPNAALAARLVCKAEKKGDVLRTAIAAKDKEPNAIACPTPVPANTEFPFVASVSSAFGYNDNVLRLGDHVSLPSGITQRDSVYNESNFSLSRDFPLRHASPSSSTGWLSDKLSLQYILVADSFEAIPSRDRILQTVYSSYQRSFTPIVGCLAKVNDDWLYVDQRLSSNILTLQAALVVNETGRGKALLSYYSLRTDNFTAQARRTSSDGYGNRIELAQSWVPIRDGRDSSTVLTLGGQYAHEWDDPTGIAARFERNEVLGKIEWKILHARSQCAFVRALIARASETWQSDHYDHGAIAPSGALSPRSDHTSLTTVGVSVPMLYDQSMENANIPDANRLEAIFEYRHNRRDSNISAKAYDQNVFLATLKVNF